MMQTSKNTKEFTVHITYSAQEISEIVRWYVNNHMPPIYNNYDFNNIDVIEMIEEQAVKKLMEIGSNNILGEYFKNLILEFTSDNGDDNG